MTLNDLRDHTNDSGDPKRLKLGTSLLYMGYLYLQTILETSYYCIIIASSEIIEKPKEYSRVWSRRSWKLVES